MKTKNLFLIALSLIALNSTYGQSTSNETSVNGITYSKTTSTFQNQKISSPTCDTVLSFPVKDTWPTGIASEGAYLWSCGADKDFIYKYSKTGQLLDSITSPSTYGLSAMVFDGSYLWAFSEEDDKLYKINTSTKSLVTQYPFSLNQSGFGIANDGNYLWITEYSNGYLKKVDKSNGQIVSSIQLLDNVLDIEMIYNELYGINTNFDYLVKIDRTTGNFTDSLSWCIGYPLGITWDGQNLWNISSKIAYGGRQRAYKFNLKGFATATQSSIDETNLSLYPNPTAEIITVNLNKELLGVTYKILDNTGKQYMTGVLNNESTPLDLKELPSGMYVLQIEGHKRGVFKVIKK